MTNKELYDLGIVNFSPELTHGIKIVDNPLSDEIMLEMRKNRTPNDKIFDFIFEIGGPLLFWGFIAILIFRI